MNIYNILTACYKHTAAVLLGLLFVLVSCNREDIPNTDTTLNGTYPIEFSGLAGWLETKAGEGEGTTTLPADFKVWAQNGTNNGTNYGVFGQAGTVVTKAAGSEGAVAWNYTPVRYWQPGSYTFYAISPAAAANGTLSGNGLSLSFGNDGWNLTSNQTDLLIATQTASGDEQRAEENGPEKVELTFDHLLSKIKFSARNADNSDLEIKVTGVKIYGNPTTAKSLTAVLSNNALSTSWTSDAESISNAEAPFKTIAAGDHPITLTKQSTEIDGVISYSYTEICSEFLVFPGTFTAANAPTIVITYKVKDNDIEIEMERSAKIVHNETSGTTWASGKIYEYTIAVSVNRITFNEPTVTAWTEGGSADNDKIEF